MPTRKPLIFEKLKTLERQAADAAPSPMKVGVFRAPVPGGWLVLLRADDPTLEQPTLFFYPDSRHDWDGGSMV